jgi:hypothetical protein
LGADEARAVGGAEVDDGIGAGGGRVEGGVRQRERKEERQHQCTFTT